ncbi:MAG: sigma 54-interacting transcriptional regulator [candidate division WOR-3 bacterium]
MKETSERKKWITESKERCRKLGLHPDNPCIAKSLHPAELHHRQECNRLLIESALPYMKICSETFRLCGSILVLTDRDGYILKAVGPESILKSRIRIGLGEGGSLREEDAGTNAVALALRHLKPTYVEGKEYYMKIFQSGACFCAPVLCNDKLMGTVVIVHPENKGHPHTFALVKILANLIQQKCENTLEFDSFANLSNLLNLIAVATDRNGTILWLNERAKKVLNVLQKDRITCNFSDDILRDGEVINEVFNSERLAMSFFVLRKEYDDKLLFFLEPTTGYKLRKKNAISVIAPYKFDDIIGLKKIKMKALRLAVQDVNLLIIGESGTGKELLASAIHNASSRVNENFVVVNCAAIPETLFESELFGYKKGAFTDARYDKIGKIEYANNGTLFFDEIAEMPLDVQAKLLRVLEDRKVIPLGSNEGRIINVRFIFATNRHIEDLVEHGKFRRDLFYRISSPALKIPPLRERRDEIPDLIENLLLKIREKYKGYVSGLTERARKSLMQFDFPGNVRQLEKILEQAFLTCKKEYIDEEDLGLGNTKPISINEKVRYYRAKLIYEQYLLNNRDVAKTCEELRLSRAQLYRYLKIANSDRKFNQG